jgi:hypothetical protein
MTATVTPIRKLVPFTLPDGMCEMGDADACPYPAAYWLVAPASYVVPLQACLPHAEDERHYFDTRVEG